MKNIFLLLCLSLAACDNGQPEIITSNITETSNQVILTKTQVIESDIKTGILEIGTIQSTTRMNGRIINAPDASYSVSFPFGGHIAQLYMKVGMYVQKGDVLLELENIDLIKLQQTYLTSLAELKYLEEDNKRQTLLNQGQATSEKILQQSNRDFQSKKIELQSVKSQLQLAGVNADVLTSNNISGTFKVVAKENGQVSQIFIQTGQYVNPSDRIAEVIDTSEIVAELTATASEINNIEVGQSVYISIVNSSEYLTTKISQISPSLNQEGVFKVYCELSPIESKPKPGVYIIGMLKTVSKAGFVAPKAAVVSWQNEHFIFLEKGEGNYVMSKIEQESEDENMILFNAEPTLINTSYVITNAYTLLMSLKNKSDN